MARLARGITFLITSVLLCLVAAGAGAEPPNLTPAERALLQSRGALDASGTTQGPVHYVAPGIKVRESMSPLHATSSDPSVLHQILVQSSPGCSQATGPLINGSFEDGTFNGWTTVGQAGTGAPSLCGSVMAPEATITDPGLQGFANFDGCIDRVYQGLHAAMLGDSIPWGINPAVEPQCNIVSQSVVIPAGTANFNFAYAVLASNPGHGFGQDPYFEVRVDDITASTNLYDVIDSTTSWTLPTNCNPWCLGGFDPIGGANVVYRCWTQVTLDLSGIAGHTVQVSLKASDCSPSAHFCEGFLDGAGISCPDSIPPDPVTLTASCAPVADSSGVSFCATINWLAPSDQSSCADSTGQCVPTTGSVVGYDIRWSTSPISTPADFAAANQASGEPSPAAPGTPESFVLCGLPQGVVYVALQSADGSFNSSAIATAQVDCETNHRPDCTNAAACVASLWPPNHKYEAVSICGVTDPDGDPVTITATGITQDEPINTRGDGNTCPDGQIVNGQASVRAERTGTPGIPGNGRVYAISFTATDSHGASCSGTVQVCVPHDQGAHSVCFDDGQKYNSLGTCTGASQLSQEITEVGLSIGDVTPSQATVEFALPKDMFVQVAVFDLAGRRIATLEDGALTTGAYQRSWDMSGSAKGLYFVRLKAGVETLTRTVVKTR